jgi:carbamoyltransferase
MSFIIGISCFYHDSSATLIKNNEIISAAQEERFTRIKHDSSFPINAIKYCLSDSNLKLNNIDYVVFYEKPFLKFERLLETYLAFAPRGFRSFCKSMPVWLKEKLFQKKIIINELKKIDKNFNKNKLMFAEHHESHAASAFYPSPFNEAIILTLDGVGEWSTSSIWIGKNETLNKVREINFPHSLGLLYSAFTYFLGFKVNSGEYKLMGLAPYGNPIYSEIIKKKLIKIYNDGSFKLNMDYFNFATDLEMTNKKFSDLFELEKRTSEDKILQKHMDIAASIQKVIEDIIIKICLDIKEKYSIKNLCLAGGVALNCVANGKIYKENIFSNIWVQPASGDSGCSLGAALSLNYKINKKGKKKNFDTMKGSYLGPKFSNNEVKQALQELGAEFEYKNDLELFDFISDKISQGLSVGWFQGRMEFGPRALGNRSILADPRDQNMQNKLNLKIKFRESFRPFAPAILKDFVSEYFQFQSESPYMLMVAQINENIKINQYNNAEINGFERLKNKISKVPAVTHVDYSARIQTVEKSTNKKFHSLITKFYEKTSCPILINTSFNIRGEPIVCNVQDAYRCFMGTNLDILVCENYVLLKENQKKSFIKDYRKSFQLD